MALLELGSVERPRLPRATRRYAVAGTVDARASDAGDSLGGRRLRPPERRLRFVRLRSAAQHGLGPHRAGRRGSLSLPVDGAEHARGGDAGAPRRLHERDHVGAQHRERGALRPARLGHHRSPAPVARPALQLRPEGRRLRPARCGRARQPDRGGAPAAAQRLSPAGVRDRRRGLQRLRAIDSSVCRDGSNQRVRDVRDGVQVRRRQLGRSPARRQQPDDAVGGRGGARGREPLRDRFQGESDAGLDGQPDVLQHGDRRLPDAGDERAVRRRARLPRERREGAGARR